MGEQSVNYLSVLVDLKSRRDRLNHAIAAVEQILGEVEPRVSSDSPAPPAQTVTNIYRKMTIGDAAAHFIKAQGKKQSMKAMVIGLKAGGISSKSKNLYGTLFNVLKARAERENTDVVKIGSEWGLTAWESES